MKTYFFISYCFISVHCAHWCERVKVLIIKTDIKFDPWVFRCLFLCTEVFSALHQHKLFESARDVPYYINSQCTDRPSPSIFKSLRVPPCLPSRCSQTITLQPKSLPLSVNKLWEGVILEQTNEGSSPLPRCELFLSADKMWVLSCHYRVLAAGLLSCRPDILNPDAIWRPGHFNSQETCTFFNSFFWDTRGTAHTLKAFMHQKPLTFMHYIHKDENFTHGVLTAIEGRLVHEMRGNIGRKLHCSATNTGTTAGSHHSDGVQFNLSGQHDVTSFPQTFFSTFAIYMLIRSMRCFFSILSSLNGAKVLPFHFKRHTVI